MKRKDRHVIGFTRVPFERVEGDLPVWILLGLFAIIFAF